MALRLSRDFQLESRFSTRVAVFNSSRGFQLESWLPIRVAASKRGLEPQTLRARHGLDSQTREEAPRGATSTEARQANPVAAGKKIAVFPEPGAIGPVMNLVGICQALRDLGHECVFILDPGLEGSVTGYGFEEQLISCLEPMSPEESARYWDDFMQKYLPSFRTSPYEQIPTYVRACWEAIASTSKWSVKNGLGDLLRKISPDLIINDNVGALSRYRAGRLPVGADDLVQRKRSSRTRTSRPMVFRLRREGPGLFQAVSERAFKRRSSPSTTTSWILSSHASHERLPFPEFVLPSPHLNLLLYPKPLQFKRQQAARPAEIRLSRWVCANRGRAL